MAIHHLNCATLRPRGARLVNGRGGLLAPARLVCHCLAVDTSDGLLLVDTGLGEADLAQPSRLGFAFRTFVRPRLAAEETAAHQLAELGYAKSDVRHIVLTHLDVDHAGGLADFPAAQIHLLALEKEAADEPARYGRRPGYRPAQWAHGATFVTHATLRERWLGLDAVRILPTVTPEVMLVPLPGHTRGHSGVAVLGGDGWILHCGDSYYTRGELELPPRVPLGLRLVASAECFDRRARLASVAQLRELVKKHAGTVRLISAHDPDELPH